MGLFDFIKNLFGSSQNKSASAWNEARDIDRSGSSDSSESPSSVTDAASELGRMGEEMDNAGAPASSDATSLGGDRIVDDMQDAVTSAGTSVHAETKGVGNMGDYVDTSVEGEDGAMSGKTSEMADKAKDVAGEVKDTATKAVNDLKGKAEDIGADLKHKADDVMDKVEGQVDKAAAKAKEVVSDFADKAEGAVGAAITKAGLDDEVKEVKAKVDEVIDKAKDKFDDIKESFSEEE